VKLKPFYLSNSFWVVLTCSLTTVVVNPWTNYDPINLPKLAILVTMIGPLIAITLISIFSKDATKLEVFIIIFFVLFSSYLFWNAFVVSNNPAQSIWGVWGRNTGSLAYIGFAAIMLSSSFMCFSDIRFVFKAFARVSYFITAYTFVQYLDLDPIPWSQSQPMATLGNINFMSSFLGLATVLFLSLVVFDKLSNLARFHYVLMSAVNLTLIYLSDSIQGIGIVLAGSCVMVVTKLIREKKKLLSLFGSVFAFVVGALVALGVAGLGPLGSRLVQQTVLYRIDYWEAGFKMFLANPIVGLGVDAYGDYYREFRSLTATERTGPARVANTAHNIFLDLMSGGGLIAVSILILPLVLIIVFSILFMLRGIASKELFITFPIVIGFGIFCLISINQIGVGTWGFAFLGVMISLLRTSADEAKSVKVKGSAGTSNLRKTIENEDSIRVKSLLSLGFFLCIFGVSFSIQQISIDSRFLSAYKLSDIKAMSNLLDEFTSTGFYEDKTLVLMDQRGLGRESLELARKIVQRDPRQFTAWTVIAYSNIASRESRIDASENLMRLDPHNEPLRLELKAEGLR
jgi:O-antigen ligase